MAEQLHVAILDDYQDAVRRLECFNLLNGFRISIYRDTLKQPEALVARLADAHAVVLIRERTWLNSNVLERLPKLRLISQTGGGVASINIDACTHLGIAVACAQAGSPEYSRRSSQASAEFTCALILSAMRRIPSQAESLKRGRWQTEVGTTVRERVLGVLGYGKIGAQVAHVGRALGMRVLAWGRDESRKRAAADGVEFAASQRALFANADVLTVQVHLNHETRSLVKSEDLAAMKPTALFVNTSRAGLIEEGALIDALRKGRPGYAALDVHDEEPLLDVGHPFLSMNNVLCTPHIAFVEQDSYEESFRNGFEHIKRFFAGDYRNIVNPGSIDFRTPLLK